jgi:hypothetical protein
MKLLKSIWSFLLSVSEAKHAANLVRNGKIKEAQNIYK